jgi:urate oxidase
MPKMRDDNTESVKITSWNYKSPMDAKLVLGDSWKADRHYRFVRKDNVDKMRDMNGYTLSGKQFKGMELMETSKDHHLDMQREKGDRNRARSKSLDENLRREVNRSGQGKVFSED